MSRFFRTLLFLALSYLGASTYAAPPTWVNLQGADGFSILAGSGITNTGPGSVNGYVGTFPTASQTGMGSMNEGCTNFGNGPTTAAAQGDLTTAYNDAMGRSSTAQVATELGGTTLATGVYNTAAGDLSIGLGLTLVLDGGGNTFSVFIFQAASTLITGSGASVTLINGAKAENVFWVVGSSATLGTNTAFKGTIMALSSISTVTGNTVDGRLLARNGAVTVDTININTTAQVPCNPSTPTDTPTTSPSFSPSPTPSFSPTLSATPSTPTTSPTLSSSPTPSFSPTLSGTPSTPTTIPTASFSPTIPSTPSVSPTVSPTRTPTSTPTPLGSAIASPTSAPAAGIYGDYIYPSPAKGDLATLVYNLKSAGDVKIKIHNQTGRLVDTVIVSKPSGTQTSPVAVAKFAAGTYYYLITVQYANGDKETRPPRKFIVLH